MNPTVPVSVVIATRDAAAYLPAALQSVATQTPQPTEIVVIDGGSTDDSVAVATNFPGVRVIAQTGRGLGAARNEGIRACTQPLIAFCDADDQWPPGALAARYAALEADPRALAVIGRVIRVALEGAEATAAQEARIGRPVPGFNLGAMLARRSVFDRIGWFDESLVLGPELDWLVRFQESRWPPLQIDTVVLHKGANGQSLSTDVAGLRSELLTVARRHINRQRGKPAG